MPQTTIDADKLRSFKYLMNKIEDKHPIFKDKPRCALLIGAGCSYKAKVPLGSGIIDICQKLNFLKNETTGTTGLIKKFYETGDVDLLNAYLDSNQLQSDLQLYIGNKKKVLWQKVEEDRAIEEKKLQEFLGQVVWDDYISCVMEDAAYGFWMDEFDNDPKERQRLIEALIDKKEPSGAYILLSYLIDRGVFNNILTTNFDDFINDALMYYTETKCRFYADDELSQYISIYSNKPNIIKLHGDYRFVNIRNTGDETMRLSRNLEIKMSELLQNFSIIVIGYNGADHSIMNALSHIKRVHNYELIWCGLDPEKVHWRVSHLINNTDNSFFVKIEGFDELIGQLYPHFSKESKPQNLIAKAEVRQKQVDAILQVYKQDFMNSAVSDDEKKEFSRSKEIDDKFNQALQEKDIDKKIELYNEVLKLDEKNNAVYNNLGIVWLEKKEYAKAIDYFDKAIAIKPDDAELLRNRGIAWHFSEQYDKAIEEFAKAINLNPQMALAYESRGVSLHASKRYENAIEDYGRAIAINPNIGSFYRNRAVSWIALDDVEKSLADNLKALELMPDDLIALNNLAYCYRAIGQLDTARQTAEAALLKFPQNPSLFTTLAEVYAQQGKEEDFYVTIQQALELGAPVWTLLEDEAYAPYKTSQRFVMLLDKYRPKP